jgi:hypothetical protein
MSDPSVELHRLEKYELREDGPSNERAVICSFSTRRFGYFQIGYDEGGVQEFMNEPDLNVFKKSDREYIKRVLAIVWKIVFDSAVTANRFK